MGTLIHAIPDIDVIDRRRFEFNDDFVGFRQFWLVGVLKKELLDSAVAVHANCLQNFLLKQAFR